MKYVVVMMMFVLAGCSSLAPMTNPPALSATAGAPVIITNEGYQTAHFSVWYPSDWKVVSSPATSAEIFAYFVNPDETGIILIAPEDYIFPLMADPNSGMIEHVMTLEADYSIRLMGTEADLPQFMALFERMANSFQIIE